MTPASKTLERLSHLHPKAIDLSLDRVKILLNDLGNPHLRLPPVIHIAGTNGKGSTLAFIRSFLEQAGYSVHIYTSPHLVRFNERICLNGQEISDESLNIYLEEIEKVNAGRPITFFEATTAAAFLAFSETPADFVLLETGMGGRLDATNVIEHPAMTLIASLSMDHEDYLGHTLAEITAEKAAIFKEGHPALASFPAPEALPVLQEFALKRHVPLQTEGKDWHIRPENNGFYYNGFFYPKPFLPGPHQYQNAGLAITAVKELEKLGLATVSEKNITDGLISVRWPGRLEKLDYPFLPPDWELWIDGGHNPGAGKVLAEFLPEWSDRPLYIICGMLATKDCSGFLKQIAPFVSSFQAVEVSSSTHPTCPAAVLSDTAQKAGMRSTATALNIQEALYKLTIGKYPAGRILICGSLYLIGNFLSLIRGFHD